MVLGLVALASCGWRTEPVVSATEETTAPATALTLAAVGDILLDRGVGARIGRYGIDYPFKQVADTLTAADLAFGNLECPLAEKSSKVIKPYCFKAELSTGQCLVKGGFDVLSLANNHTMDCSRGGLVETMDRLKLKGIRWCGAGRTRAGAERATVVEKNGLRVAFVAFCEFLPEGSFLRDDRPTIAFASKANIKRAVAAALPLADAVVASFHWGVEYASRPSSRQVRWARAAAEAGADLVIGHHPHVLQGLELVANGARESRRSLIAYSLGNFVFDQRLLRNRQSAILRCSFGKQGVVGADLVPVRLDGCRPRRATEKEAKPILARLAGLSAERKTVVKGGRLDFAQPKR